MKKIILLLIMTCSVLCGKAQVDLYNDLKGKALKGKIKKMTTFTTNYKKDNNDSFVIDKSECYVTEYNYTENGVYKENCLPRKKWRCPAA